MICFRDFGCVSRMNPTVCTPCGTAPIEAHPVRAVDLSGPAQELVDKFKCAIKGHYESESYVPVSYNDVLSTTHTIFYPTCARRLDHASGALCDGGLQVDKDNPLWGSTTGRLVALTSTYY
jgi:hypothetical protein